MKFRKFGNIDFNVSVIGLGGAALSGEGAGYGFGHMSESEALKLVDYAMDAGVNLIDTAPIYGFGVSETRIGKALKSKREKAFLVSKSGVGWHSTGRVDMDNDPKKTQKMLEDSLKRLNTDYIDLYMIHWPDSKWDIRYPLEVLAKAMQQDKILNIGLCNTNITDLERSQEVAEVAAVQMEYNLINRDGLMSLKDYIAANKLAVMTWGTLDKGILAGTVTTDRKYDDVDSRRKAPWWKKNDVAKKLDLVSKVQGEFKDTDILTKAIANNLKNDFVHTSLCGFKTIDQLDNLLRIVDAGFDHVPINEIHEFIDGRI